jgi:hypothetical protein
VIDIRISNCNTDCDYFKWDEVGESFKAYCLKENDYVKNIKRCNKEENGVDENGGTKIPIN